MISKILEQCFLKLPYFNSFEKLIVSAHIAYGWMPTTLRVHKGKDELDNAFKAFQRLVKDESDSEEADLKALIAVFNNSIVGVSKMLHFAAPERFAIWDSKVAAACGYTLNGSRRRDAKAYMRYVEQLQELVSKREFKATYVSVKQQISKMGVETDTPLLSRLRVGEMLLFLRLS